MTHRETWVYSHDVKKNSAGKMPSGQPSFKTLREYVRARTQKTTQSQIAEELGIKPNTLSNYLSHNRIPSREIALRLSRHCGIPLENLLDPELAKSA